ncbi:MAG: SCP2 sterol-binding domain-containing protein [Rhodothermales bacterium]|nr:SCP2 sterol-binding domain-containing protein [Rhodothermales bacterium]
MPTYTSIADVMASYPDRFIPSAAAGVDGVVQLDLTGEGGGQYQLIIRDQTLRIEEGPHADPTVTVTVDADDWLKVNNGEANAMALLMQGRLKVKGSLPMATKFQTMFQRAGA